MALAVLAFGQSNMVGSRGPSPNSNGFYSRTVKAWNVSTNTMALATLGAAPFQEVDANGNGSTPNNLAWVFCKEIARHCEEGVYLCMIAAANMPIEHFMLPADLSANGWSDPDSSWLGASAWDNLFSGDGPSALAAAGRTKYDICIMHQGERNAQNGDTETAYLAKMEVQFGRLTTEGLITLGETPIIVGHINPAYPGAANHAAAIEAFKASHANVSTVPWAGVETGADKHATGKGLEQLGFRYFNEYAKLGLLP